MQTRVLNVNLSRWAAILVGVCFEFAASGAPALKLNNLVTELLRVERVPVTAGTLTFQNPRDGWVFVTLRAAGHEGEKVELTLDEKIVLEITAGRGVTGETMRLLPKGQHVLRVRRTGAPTAGPLVVRAMPETHYIRYPQEPRFPELGVFSWEWLKNHVLANVNLIAVTPGQNPDTAIDEWTRSGRKFIAYGSLPHEKNLTGPQAFEFWFKNRGFQDPRLSGLIADEFSGRQHPLYPAWIEGMRLLGEKMKGTGKAFYAYTGGPGMHSRPEAHALVRTVIDAGFYMAWERYHHEMPTEDGGRNLIDQLLGEEIARWRAAFPDLLAHLVMVLGVFAAGPDLDVQPNVNYKVWMDMQMRYLATHPGFDGLFGVHWWYSGGANEELLRWASALYRHYAIEGATDLLSQRYGWTYTLPHLVNPDFVEGLKGWTATPAADGTVKPDYLERYARAQNRYWHRTSEPDYPDGNSYLWMKRQPNRPNRVVQEVRNLVPGRLYSVQMITADYQDIRNGRSERKQHAASLRIEGARVIPEMSYRSIPVSNSYSHAQLPFLNGPAWFNHHRLMFRATQPTALLTISDWASDGDASGPAGQELMFNYVQLQPYFEAPRPIM